ncbi:hypothetical protein LIA77_00722 [Sarocladium implicatum]|nr:hypothetical protein LIA77_00722 [Sarocladium implicatum]
MSGVWSAARPLPLRRPWHAYYRSSGRPCHTPFLWKVCQSTVPADYRRRSLTACWARSVSLQVDRKSYRNQRPSPNQQLNTPPTDTPPRLNAVRAPQRGGCTRFRAASRCRLEACSLRSNAGNCREVSHRSRWRGGPCTEHEGILTLSRADARSSYGVPSRGNQGVEGDRGGQPRTQGANLGMASQRMTAHVAGGVPTLGRARGARKDARRGDDRWHVLDPAVLASEV